MTVTQSILDGAPILSITHATPTGMDLELRGARRRQVFASLCVGNQTVLYINAVHATQVMVGRITDELHCLFIGSAAIDITPAAASAINAWLASTVLKEISA